MQKIIAVADKAENISNWCKEQQFPPDRLVWATDPRKLAGLREYRYIVITLPEKRRSFELMQQEFRKARAVELSLDINDWPLTEFS